MKKIKVFVICSVRGMPVEYKKKLEKYAAELESRGYAVHLPHRHTDQNASGVEICTQNANAIKNADEVHIFYRSESQGTHFDMGVAWAFLILGEKKKLVIVENEELTEGKSYQRMLTEWEKIVA